MDGRILARLGAVVFVAIAIGAAAIEISRGEKPSSDARARLVEPAAPDPLRESLRRCQLLGEAGARDGTCLRAWGESRDRFLGLAPALTPPQVR